MTAVRLVITLSDNTMRECRCAPDGVLSTLRQQFPGWRNCDVFTLQTDKEALAVYDAVQLPIRQLHNCTV